MKKIIETTESRTVKKVESITCDICKETHNGSEGYEGNRWTSKSNNFDYDLTVIVWKTGSMYPGGGGGDKIEFDVCPICFSEKLIPAMKALGAEPNYSDWDC